MTLLERALVEEAAKKSSLVWVAAPDGSSRALWHVWHEGAVHVVGDGGEQPLHGLADGGGTTVTARSKDKGGRLVAWPVVVRELAPGGRPWLAAVGELKAKRLNAADSEGVIARWAEGSRVLRLEAAGAPTQGPGSMPEGSGAAPPVATGATTRRPVPAALPRLLARRKRQRHG